MVSLTTLEGCEKICLKKCSVQNHKGEMKRMPTNLLKKNKIAQVCGINFQGTKKGCFQEPLMQS